MRVGEVNSRPFPEVLSEVALRDATRNDVIAYIAEQAPEARRLEAICDHSLHWDDPVEWSLDTAVGQVWHAFVSDVADDLANDPDEDWEARPGMLLDEMWKRPRGWWVWCFDVVHGSRRLMCDEVVEAALTDVMSGLAAPQEWDITDELLAVELVAKRQLAGGSADPGRVDKVILDHMQRARRELSLLAMLRAHHIREEFGTEHRAGTKAAEALKLTPAAVSKILRGDKQRHHESH
ncbi:hypothetical protein AB0C34_18200 [Nocardia sp. NPDC049220]|uniref:hypothetical protein n=1 Tax=Nocardia sp. NPDC049220 TaxID=3155273 RepID=UPI0033FA09AA